MKKRSTDRSSEYLDPRWQKLRLDVFERDRFACCNCGNKKRTLHVHHLYYVAKRHPWEYPTTSLLTLCDKCHKSETDRRGMSESGQFQDWEFMLGWLFAGLGRGPAFSLIHTVAAAVHRLPCDWETMAEFIESSVNSIPENGSSELFDACDRVVKRRIDQGSTTQEEIAADFFRGCPGFEERFGPPKERRHPITSPGRQVSREEASKFFSDLKRQLAEMR